jgi:hypothetical protein
MRQGDIKLKNGAVPLHVLALSRKKMFTGCKPQRNKRDDTRKYPARFPLKWQKKISFWGRGPKNMGNGLLRYR